MGYEQAAKIRQSGYLNEVSKNLLNDKSIKQSLKSSISDVTRAKAVGIKEKFDPLNIAKKLSFGSPIGAALLGTLTGRSKEDIEYFTGLKSKKSKATKAPKSVDPKEPPKSILDKLFVMFKEQSDEERKIRELKQDSAEEMEVNKEKNHKEILGILESISLVGSPESDPEEKKPGSITSLFKMLGKMKGLFKGRGGKGRTTPGGTSRPSTPSKIPSGPGAPSKIIIGGGLGLTALLAKGEAGTYDTAVGNQKTPKPLTQMTLKEIDDWQGKSKISGGAVGKYQIIRTTLRAAKRSLNLKDTDVFTQELQDEIYVKFLTGSEKRPALNAYLTGKSDNIEAAHLDLAREFASVPVPYDIMRPPMYGKPGKMIKAGQSYYGGIGGNSDKTSLTIKETQQRLIEQRDLNSGKLKPKEQSNKGNVGAVEPVAGMSVKPNKSEDTSKVAAVSSETPTSAQQTVVASAETSSLQPEKQESQTTFTPTSVALVNTSTPKINSAKVSSVSKENDVLVNNLNNTVAQIMIKNNVVNISKSGDTQITVMSSDKTSSDAILMQSMKA